MFTSIKLNDDDVNLFLAKNIMKTNMYKDSFQNPETLKNVENDSDYNPDQKARTQANFKFIAMFPKIQR